MLEIDNAKVDMSCRQTPYTLKGMSFREYLEYEGILKTEAVPLETLLYRSALGREHCTDARKGRFSGG